MQQGAHVQRLDALRWWMVRGAIVPIMRGRKMGRGIMGGRTRGNVGTAGHGSGSADGCYRMSRFVDFARSMGGYAWPSKSIM
jgi:hypothetical protein